MRIPAFIAIPLILLVSSCTKEDFLSGDEKDSLFAAPTTAEITTIYNDWQSRDLMPTDYTVVQQADLLSGKFRLRIVSFRVNNIKEYGALLIPATDSLLPVRMYVGGFGLGATTNSVNLSLDNSGSGVAYILAIPALRGQSLEITINGTTWTTPVSEGNHCDAFDGATDDVLAFLNGIQQTESYADVNRTSVRGGSRGGTVALLAGIRDARVKKVTGVVEPTNMLELTSKNTSAHTYQCQFLDVFKNGQSSLGETRNKMIASSPIYFAQHLPLTQLHMGLRDMNVPVKQGVDLENKMKDLGKEAGFQLFIYDKTHADIAINNPELTQRIEAFLSQ